MKREKTKDKRIKRIGKIYYVRFSKRGCKISESLYTDSFEIAVGLADKIERAILNGEDYKLALTGVYNKNHALISDLWPEFIIARGQGKNSTKRLRDKTIYEYANFWTRYFEDFWGNKTLFEITEDAWDDYIQYAYNKSRRGSDLKIFNHWKYFNGFLTWCVKKGYLEKKPVLHNPDEEPEDGVGINLSDEQLRSLRENSAYHPAFHLCILIAQYMGMRSGEITQLLKDRINLNSKLISLKKIDTKNKQARKVPIHSAVTDALLDQIKVSGSSPALFPNRKDNSRPMDRTGFKKPWDKVRVDSGVECRFHDLRHSYATRVFANPTLNPVLACKSLGMSMNTAMKVYIHFDEKHYGLITEGFRL